MYVHRGELWIQEDFAQHIPRAVAAKHEARHRKCDGENCSKHSAVSSLGVMCLAVFFRYNISTARDIVTPCNPKVSRTLGIFGIFGRFWQIHTRSQSCLFWVNASVVCLCLFARGVDGHFCLHLRDKSMCDSFSRMELVRSNRWREHQVWMFFFFKDS